MLFGIWRIRSWFRCYSIDIVNDTIFILLFSFIDYDTRLKAGNTFAICERLSKVMSYVNVHIHINFDLVLARMLFVFVAQFYFLNDERRNHGFCNAIVKYCSKWAFRYSGKLHELVVRSIFYLNYKSFFSKNRLYNKFYLKPVAFCFDSHSAS